MGSSINARTEKHGEDSVPAMDVQLNLLITSSELDELNGEGTAERTFDEGGGLRTPIDKHFAPRKFKGRFADSSADLWVGLDVVQLHFADCTIKGITLDPQFGGMSAVKLTVQALIVAPLLTAFLWMDREAECELQLGELKADDLQGELALKVAEDADEPDEERQAAPRRGRGRPRKSNHGRRLDA